MKKIVVLALILILYGLLPVQAQTTALQYCPDANSRAVYWLEDLTDQTSNSYTLTNNNLVSFVAGNFNNAADFGIANTNKYLDIANNLGWTGSSDLSISVWVKIRTEPTAFNAPGAANLVNIWNGVNKVNMRIHYGNEAGTLKLAILRDNSGIGEVVAKYPVTLGTSSWHHVALTYNGTSGVGKLYLDGSDTGATFTQIGNGTHTSTFSDRFNIGAYGDGLVIPQYMFASAYFDEVVVSSSVFSSTDVANIFNRTNPPIGCSTPPPPQPATEATLQAVKSKTDNLDILLSSRATESTQLQVKSNTDILIARTPKPWQFYTDSGKGFGVVIDGLILTTINRADILLIKNPSASGIITRLKRLYASPDRDFVNIEIYRNPTITSNGIPLAPFNHKSSGGLATTQLFQSPVISSRGTLVFSGKLDAFLKTINFELARFLEAGENLLIVLQADRANIEVDLTLDFAEE